jgi:hypothetical protein
MKWLRDILTSDAQSSVYDLVRIGTALSLVVGLALDVFVVVWRNQPFDFASFGTGLGLILGAGGAAMWARRDREADPHAPIQPPTE